MGTLAYCGCMAVGYIVGGDAPSWGLARSNCICISRIDTRYEGAFPSFYPLVLKDCPLHSVLCGRTLLSLRSHSAPLPLVVSPRSSHLVPVLRLTVVPDCHHPSYCVTDISRCNALPTLVYLTAVKRALGCLGTTRDIWFLSLP